MTIEQALTLANSPVVQALVALVTGLIGTAVRYRQTGRLPLATLPWRALRRTVYALRRQYFTVPRPDREPFVVTETVDAVRDQLASQSYNPNWTLSYRYYDEDLNARRYYHDPERAYPHRQLHIRGFEADDGTVELIAHEEPAPEHHPRAHLKEVDLHDATDWLADTWESQNLDPRGFERQPDR